MKEVTHDITAVKVCGYHCKNGNHSDDFECGLNGDILYSIPKNEMYLGTGKIIKR